MSEDVNEKSLTELYERGVLLYKSYDFDISDDPHWSRTSVSGKRYAADHFSWLSEVFNELRLDQKHIYIVSKLVKEITFSEMPSDHWISDNPESFSVTVLFKDIKAIISELEEVLDNQPSIKKDEEGKISRITYDKFTKQISLDPFKPLSLRNTERQRMLCEVLLKYKRPLGTDQVLEQWEWSPDRIYDENGRLQPQNRLKIYNAAKSLNAKIETATSGQVKEFILVTTKEVQINPIYRGVVS